MSFVKSADTIYSVMQKQNLRYWQVFDTDKSSLISESDDGENLTVGNSIEDLRNVIEGLDGIIFIVVRSDTATKKRKFASEGTTNLKADTYAGIYKFQLRVGTALDEAINKPNNNNFFGSNNSMLTMLMNLQKENSELALKNLQDKFEAEKAMSERLANLEKKIEKKGSGSDDQMNAKILEVLDRLLKV